MEGVVNGMSFASHRDIICLSTSGFGERSIDMPSIPLLVLIHCSLLLSQMTLPNAHAGETYRKETTMPQKKVDDDV
jgi:hypothetical protein